MDVLESRPTSAMSERDLEHAGLGRARGWDEGQGRRIEPRSEPCACGGIIRIADTGDEWLVARSVRIHNDSTPHRQWAIANGWRFDGKGR